MFGIMAFRLTAQSASLRWKRGPPPMTRISNSIRVSHLHLFHSHFHPLSAYHTNFNICSEIVLWAHRPVNNSTCSLSTNLVSQCSTDDSNSATGFRKLKIVALCSRRCDTKYFLRRGHAAYAAMVTQEHNVHRRGVANSDTRMSKRSLTFTACSSSKRTQHVAHFASFESPPLFIPHSLCASSSIARRAGSGPISLHLQL